jgi:hypothetical protein
MHTHVNCDSTYSSMCACLYIRGLRIISYVCIIYVYIYIYTHTHTHRSSHTDTHYTLAHKYLNTYTHTHTAAQSMAKSLRDCILHTEDLRMILDVQTDNHSANSPWRDAKLLPCSNNSFTCMSSPACAKTDSDHSFSTSSQTPTIPHTRRENVPITVVHSDTVVQHCDSAPQEKGTRVGALNGAGLLDQMRMLEARLGNLVDVANRRPEARGGA